MPAPIAPYRHPSTTIAALHKMAELGGNADDNQFEQAMSGIAHTYLRTQAPALLPYEVGFQILDKSKESDRVSGVTGFKIGEQWLYAPIFFMKGKVKGQELLYDKNRDQFIPLKENWVNFYLKRRPSILGDRVPKNTNQFKPSSPDFRTMFRSPKLASAQPVVKEGMRQGVAAMAHFVSSDPFNDPKYDGVCDIPKFLKKEGAVVIRALVRNLNEHPVLAQAFAERWGGLGIIEDAIKEAKANQTSRVFVPEKRAAAKKADAVTVYMKEEFPTDSVNLSDSDREQLLDKAILIKDDRGDNQVARAFDDGEKKVANPTVTGIYPVLMANGSFQRCFVGSNALDGHGPTGMVLVVPIGEDKMDGCLVSGDKVFVREDSCEDWKDWWSGLPTVSAGSLTSGGDGARFSVIGPGGCSSPMRVYPEDGTSGDDFCADFVYAKRHRDGTFPTAEREDDSEGYDDRVRIAPKGVKFRADRGVLHVPDNFRVVRVSGSWEDKTEKIELGTARELDRMIFNKFASMTIGRRGENGYVIDNRLFDSRSALVHLVVDHNLREKTASSILESAPYGNLKKFRIEKVAAWANPMQMPASSPAFAEPPAPYPDPRGHAVEAPFEASAPLGFATADQASVPDGIDSYTANAAAQAAQFGQREVLDTSTLASTLKSVRDDSMIDRHLPDLYRGLDRIGRIYCSYCAHSDLFEDRYGKQDMPELEDSLRNTFENVGDTILFLQQKSVQPYHDSFSADLSDAAA